MNRTSMTFFKHRCHDKPLLQCYFFIKLIKDPGKTQRTAHNTTLQCKKNDANRPAHSSEAMPIVGILSHNATDKGVSMSRLKQYSTTSRFRQPPDWAGQVRIQGFNAYFFFRFLHNFAFVIAFS